MGLFKKIKKALKFEAFNVKGIIKDIAKNPQRLLVGAVDPLGTKIANTILGTKWKPVVNQLGGATKERFAAAEAKGMDVGLAKSLHAVAGVVAGIWGGAALGNLAGAGVKSLAGANVANSTAAATQAGSVGGDITPVVTTATKVGQAAAPAVDTAAQAAGGIIEPVNAAAQVAEGVIEPVTTTATRINTAGASGGMLSKAASLGKDIYKLASSDAGKTIIATGLQGYAQGKAQKAEQNYQDKYRRAFSPEELAQMNTGAPSGSGGYLDRARRVSDFLGDRGKPTDPATVAGYARGDF